MRGCRLQFIVQSREQWSGKTTRRSVKLPHANFQSKGGTRNQDRAFPMSFTFTHAAWRLRPSTSIPSSGVYVALELLSLFFVLVFRLQVSHGRISSSVTPPPPPPPPLVPFVTRETNILQVYMNRWRTVLTVCVCVCVCVCETKAVFVCLAVLFMYFSLGFCSVAFSVSQLE